MTYRASAAIILSLEFWFVCSSEGSVKPLEAFKQGRGCSDLLSTKFTLAGEARLEGIQGGGQETSRRPLE